MPKANKTNEEISQEVQEIEEMCQDIRARGTPPAGEILGPGNPEDLLGRQDAPGGTPAQYAVCAEGGLNLREVPGLDAPILAVLPCGIGVFLVGEVQGPWWKVTTGKLTGWVLGQHLEPLWN